MKFSYTIIYVKNVPETIDFYQKAFKLKLGFIHDSQQYAELDTGNTKLAFASEELAKSNGVDFELNTTEKLSPCFEIALTSEDVENDFDFACQHGATVIKKPTKKPWGQLVGYVKDVNGIIIEICSPV